MLNEFVFVPPPTPSRRARELATALVRLAGEYQAREGKLSGPELEAAFRLAAEELGGGAGRRRLVILALVLGLLLAVGLSALLVIKAGR